MRNRLLTIIIAAGMLNLLPASSKQAQAQENAHHISQDSLKFKPIETLSRSADKVTRDRMNKGLVNNPIEALSGQAAGVSITPAGSNPTAMLNSVRVRGTTSLTGGNDPLVIIDGVSADLTTLSSIYPGDIESFTILKNAAETAKYGSRGASGVIEVTTVKGHGEAFQISYDVNMSLQAVYKNIEMLNASEYIALAKQGNKGWIDGGYDTNFPEAITRTGFVQNHHLAFSGGNSSSNYRASIGYLDNRAVVKTNAYRNFIAKVDLMQKAFDDLLTIDLGVFGSSQKSNELFDTQKIFYAAASMNPTMRYGRDASGSWNKNPNASQIDPPDALLRMKNDTKMLNFNTHMQLGFRVSNDISAKLFGSYTYTSQENGQFCPTWVWAQGQAIRDEAKSDSWLVNATLDFAHRWGTHTLKATLMGEYQKETHSAFWTQVKGLSSNEFGYNNLGAASIRPYGGTGSSYDSPSLASLMGSVSYTLKNRYTLALTSRADGSSMVGDDNTWGFFPSISAEWDVKAEPFMKHVGWISRLALRAGHGQAGNLGGISPYYSMALMEQNGTVPMFGSPTVTMTYLRNYNPDLKWETRSTTNVGVDLGILDNRLMLTTEYYYSKTTDMLYLYSVPVPPFTYDKLLANVGSMSNRGLELGLSYTPIRKKDMDLHLNVNIAWQKNKLESLDGDYRGYTLTGPGPVPIGQLNGAGFHGGNNNIVYQMEGQPLGVFYIPHCTGLTKNPDGSYYYAIEDLNGDGVGDADDRYVAGQATPKMTLGSNISFRYKHVDLSLQMNGAFGHKIYNGTSLTYMNISSFPDYNVMKEAPRHNINDQTVTDYWLERGDYLNFDYLTVGWNVPLRSSRHISSLRLSCSVNNLATITSYSGLTPMINSHVVSNTLGIDDKRSYPVFRSYTMAVSIQF